MLTDRQLYVFKSIVELYAKHGKPIGSKTLLKLKDLDYSSATIRNDMSAIEALGLIEKPHTSSGRIPSLEGYRFYVDQFLKEKEQENHKMSAEHQLLLRTLDNPFQRIDDIIHSSANILSYLTKYTAMVVGPESANNKLVSFRLAPLTHQQVMAIIVTDDGAVENIVFRLPADLDYSSMLKMVRIIEDELVGQNLYEVYRRLNNDIPRLVHRYAANVQDLFEEIVGVFEQSQRHRLHIGGEMNLVDFIEEHNLKQFKSLYQLFENNRYLMQLIQSSDDRINIRIGDELENDHLANFSLITANYDVNRYGSGTIAILGPTNMAYSKNIQLIEAFQDVLPIVIQRYYEHRQS